MKLHRHKKTLNRRHVVIFSVLCCCLFLVGVTLAKMKNDVLIEKGDNAQVAGWSVDVSSSDSGSMTLDAGSSSQSYSLVVTNNSEVTNAYSVKVSNIPAGVKIGLDVATDDELVTPTGGQIVFTNTGGDLSYLAPDNTRSHTLTLAAEASANITQSDVDMAIEVLFTQKEPRS